ncbi:hypothetical protein BH10PSE6_BH10PSE6_01060 [soil metagenome]
MLRFVSINRSLRKWLAACLVFVSIGPSVAQPLDWPAAQRQLAGLSLDTQCQQAWELLWSWAKQGEIGARVELSNVVGIGWLRPPGINQDLETHRRHAFTFLLHSLPSGDPGVLQEVERTVTIYRSMTRASAKPYLDCVAASDRSACVGRLVERGLVADFAAYARELDILAAAPGARPAECPANAFHRRARQE